MKEGEAAGRAYVSPLRDRQARETRRLIVRTAARLFAERGYVATSITDIAREAGVGRATVSAAVGTKPVLLKQAFDTTIAGDDDPLPMTERAPARAIGAQSTGAGVLEAYADHAVAIWARVAALAEAVRGAAGADPDARAQWEESQQQRHRAARLLVDDLLAVDRLRPGLDPDAAADEVWVLNDATLYHALVHQRGWSRERYRTWLARSLRDRLLGPGNGPDPASADPGSEGRPSCV
jgi:AcrR family transcriptional regulator